MVVRSVARLGAYTYQSVIGAIIGPDDPPMPARRHPPRNTKEMPLSPVRTRIATQSVII